MAENKNEGTINMSHFSLFFCERQSELFRFVRFVIKFAAIFFQGQVQFNLFRAFLSSYKSL